MTAALATRPGIRLTGRSFLAFVLEPQPPLADWLADLDSLAGQSFAFFTNRPVVLDLSRLKPQKDEVQKLIDTLRARAIRIVSVEGIDPNWVEPALAPLGNGKDSAKVIEFPTTRAEAAPAPEPVPPPETAPEASFEPEPEPAKSSLIIDRPVRSGQSVYNPDGDVVVLGSVSSGAEIIAAGSIHVYGTLRGRALAGATGGPAFIFCRRYQAELVSIDGIYMTAEQSKAELIGKPAQIRLRGHALITESLE